MLTRIYKISCVKCNAFTAFINAIHEVFEMKHLKEEVDENELFLERFEHFLGELSEPQDEKLVEQMRCQGKHILPEIEDALEDYFGEYEVL